MQHPAQFPMVRHPAGGWPEDAALADFPLEERIVVALAHQPWASASDLAKRLDVSNPDIHKACHVVEENGSIAGRELGVTRRIQRRYVLSREGVMQVTKPFECNGLLRAALPLTWQMAEDGATRMLLWLPMIESLYEILPTFWTGGLAAPFQWQSMYADPSCSRYVWLGEPTLMEVLWLPRGRLHAVATWRFERYGEPPRYYSVPFFWTGLLPQEDYRSRSLRLGSEYIRSLRSPEDKILWEIEPPVVAIAVDQFGAFRARTAYGDDAQVGAVDTAGGLVWSAEASHSEWTLGDNPPQPRSIGRPEAAAIGEGHDLVNLGGMREYRLLTFVSEFRGATKANLVRAFRMSRGATTAALEHLENRGLVTSVGGNLYITQRGLHMLAQRDRVDIGRLVEVTYRDPEGQDAVRERRHDSAVAEAAAAFWGAGFQVVAGWRWVVSWKDGQLVPDLWAQMPVPGRKEGIWVAVEVEFSAKTEKRIEAGKLRSYRLAPVRLNKTFPILVITGEALPAQRFDNLAGDLPVLTTTLKEFLSGVWEGPESIWRRKGRPVGLSDIAREHQYHLLQQTGRSVDYSKPSPEVWEKFIRREESIWSDPRIEELDLDLPLIGPQLQAEMDRVGNEAKTGTSEVAPVAAPVPPSVSPGPLRKAGIAQDRALNDAREGPSANKPVAATIPPTPPPTPVRKVPTGQELALQRLQAVRRIDRLFATVDERAASRLQRKDLSEAERLCLWRVRAIITYGAYRHCQTAEPLVKEALSFCLSFEDAHHRVVRSKNPLWWLTVSQTKSDPRWAFKHILKDYRKTNKDARKKFNYWADMVDRAALEARTLEQGAP